MLVRFIDVSWQYLMDMSKVVKLLGEGKGETSENILEKSTDLTSSMPLVTDEEREMANKATEEFDKGNYDICLKMLRHLQEKRGPDPRIMLNVAVIAFYKSGQTKTEEFRKALFESANKAQVKVEDINALDDIDQCVFYYNHAILLYHLRQYRSAETIIDKLFTFLEPMEESLSRRVQFLLIELCLCTHQPDKALGVLAFLEKTLFGNGKSQAEGKEDKNGKDASKEGNGDGHGEQYKCKISQYKVRCYMMLRSMKAYKRELKLLIGYSPNTSPTTYMKSNFEYQRSNYRKAVKLLNASPQPGRPASQTGESLNTMHYNNMAVLHFYMHKPNMAAFYLQKATSENEQEARNFHKPGLAGTLSGRPINTLGISRHYELLYNTGLSLLHAGKSQTAFNCLHQLTSIYRSNPRLWLRIAECCVHVYKNDNDDDRHLAKRMEVVKGSVGSGVHRKLILGSGLKNDKKHTDLPIVPAATLEFASLCLKNSLVLLPEDPLDATPPSGEDGEILPSGEGLVPAPPGNPLRPLEVANLRSSVLLCMTYVSLCLNDFVTARNTAERLLKQPRLSGVQKYLGHLYLAEALVGVDRIADAISHLNPDNLTDISIQPPDTRQDNENGDKNGDKEPDSLDTGGTILAWTPHDLPRGKAIMQYNLATAHAIRGEFEKALMHLGKSTKPMGLPLPAQMYFLKIYLELMEGRRKIAHSIIKEHFGHVTPNRV